ncbi:Hypothetical predicted protein, partial [Marmota monax]
GSRPQHQSTSPNYMPMQGYWGTIGSSTCEELSATHPEQKSQTLLPRRTQAASHELQPPPPTGPPSTNVGLPWSSPSWDSAGAEIVPYMQ